MVRYIAKKKLKDCERDFLLFLKKHTKNNNINKYQDRWPVEFLDARWRWQRAAVVGETSGSGERLWDQLDSAT